MDDTLIERLEAASGPDRELDHWIQLKVVQKGQRGMFPTDEAFVAARLYHPYFTASIDAALKLVPEGQDWYVTAIRPLTGRFAGAVYRGEHPQTDYAEAATPALALCIAALRAQAGGAA